VQVTAVASTRNQQDPTTVLRDESAGILLGECQDGGQGACQNDVGWLTNRAKNSHQPFRRQEGAMSKFRDVKTLQKFASIHASIHNHFNLERHLTPRETFKQNRAAAMAEWRQLAA
jgi:putative transposase